MNNLILMAMQKLFSKLQVNDVYDTPAGQSEFSINCINNDSIKITSRGGNRITIKIQAFIETIKYLLINGNDENNPIEIRSSQTDPGPLSLAAMNANNKSRCITYILPILQQHRIVGIRAGGGSECWYV